jgi:hypothetical protein
MHDKLVLVATFGDFFATKILAISQNLSSNLAYAYKRR